MIDNDYTTQFISYCKHGNWVSIKRLIEKEKARLITFNIQRGFKVACVHKQYSVLRVLTDNYNLNYLLNGGYFINHIVQNNDISILEYILKSGNFIFTPDMHSFIEIPFSHKQYDMVDLFLLHADIADIIDYLITDEAKSYCTKKLRELKINKLKGEK